MIDAVFIFIRKLSHFLFAKFHQSKLLQPHLAYEKHIWHVMANCLGVTVKMAQNMYRQGSLDNAKFWLDNRWMTYASDTSVAKAVDQIKLENEEFIDEALSYNRPILIISIHMGSYYLGFLKLAMSVGDRRDISVIKLNAASVQESRIHELFEQRYGQIKSIRINDEPAQAAFMALRKGGILAVLTDMEARVSDRSEVQFMGKSCFLQNGPAKLALTTGAIIVPIVNYIDDGGHPMLRIERPFIARRENNENNVNAVQRITSSIALVIDKWIRMAPTQVHYWSEICRIMQNTASTSKAK